MDVWEVDHGQRAKGERVLRVRDGGNEICVKESQDSQL